MKVAVCDDQPEILLEMQKILLKEEDIRSVDIYGDIEIFFSMINEEKVYDVVFMDIDWKSQQTGIDFAKRLYQCCPDTKLVYITSYALEYVEDVFLGQSNLSGFLTKPIKEKQLKRNIDKIRKEREDVGKKLLVKWKGEIIAVPFSQIRYLEGKLHKTYIYAVNREYQCGDRVETLKQQLDQRFLNCHKSYLVNMDYIYAFQRAEIFLDPKDGTTEKSCIPVSKSKLKTAKQTWLSYVGEKL